MLFQLLLLMQVLNSTVLPDMIGLNYMNYYQNVTNINGVIQIDYGYFSNDLLYVDKVYSNDTIYVMSLYYKLISKDIDETTFIKLLKSRNYDVNIMYGIDTISTGQPIKVYGVRKGNFSILLYERIPYGFYVKPPNFTFKNNGNVEFMDVPRVTLYGNYIVIVSDSDKVKFVGIKSKDKYGYHYIVIPIKNTEVAKINGSIEQVVLFDPYYGIIPIDMKVSNIVISKFIDLKFGEKYSVPNGYIAKVIGEDVGKYVPMIENTPKEYGNIIYPKYVLLYRDNDGILVKLEPILIMRDGKIETNDNVELPLSLLVNINGVLPNNTEYGMFTISLKVDPNVTNVVKFFVPQLRKMNYDVVQNGSRVYVMNGQGLRYFVLSESMRVIDTGIINSTNFTIEKVGRYVIVGNKVFVTKRVGGNHILTYIEYLIIVLVVSEVVLRILYHMDKVEYNGLIDLVRERFSEQISVRKDGSVDPIVALIESHKAVVVKYANTKNYSTEFVPEVIVKNPKKNEVYSVWINVVDGVSLIVKDDGVNKRVISIGGKTDLDVLTGHKIAILLRSIPDLKIIEKIVPLEKPKPNINMKKNLETVHSKPKVNIDVGGIDVV